MTQNRIAFFCWGLTAGILLTKWRAGIAIDWYAMFESMVWYMVGMTGAILVLLLIGWLVNRHERTR